jgi:outer membrane protein assembly factor BamB
VLRHLWWVLAVVVLATGMGCPEPNSSTRVRLRRADPSGNARQRRPAIDGFARLMARFGKRCDACFAEVIRVTMGRHLTNSERLDKARRRRSVKRLRSEMGMCLSGRGYGDQPRVTAAQVRSWLRSATCKAFAQAAFKSSGCISIQSVPEEVGYPAIPPTLPVVPPPKIHRKPVWRARIGKTTYRSTIHFWKDKIVINSNGQSLKSTRDSQDGVYLFDAKTGRRLMKIVPPGKGEKDCNGVALNKRGLFFGTDQPRFYHYNWRGKLVWQAKVQGDPESAPALVDLNGDAYDDVVFGTDTGYVYALDGRRGRKLWSFRAKTGSYGQQSIYAAPAVLRLGTEALVFIAARDHFLYAIGGRTGKIVWTYKGRTALRASPILTDTDGDGRPELVFASAYGAVYVVHPLTGRLKWSRRLAMPTGGIVGIFASLAYHPQRSCVLVASSWWKRREAVWCVQKSGVAWRVQESRKNLTSTPVLADVDGDKKLDIIYGTESGYLMGVDPKGRRRFRWRLAGAVEISPLVADVDADGRLDIFVADASGYLYRFELSRKGKVAVGYHRGDPRNQGVWGKVKPYAKRDYKKIFLPRHRPVHHIAPR